MVSNSDSEGEALATALSFLDEALDARRGGEWPATDGLTASYPWQQLSASCSPPPVAPSGDLDDFLELDVDFDAYASLLLEWEGEQHEGASVASLDSSGVCHDAVKPDSQASSPATSAEETESPSRATSACKQRVIGKPRTRTTQSNPNRARDEQRRELRRLRIDAAELQEQLSVLRSYRCSQQHLHSVSAGSVRSGKAESIAVNVWKAVAARQLEKRMASAHENTQLRSAVHENQATIQRMAKLLRSHNAEKAVQHFCIERSHRISRLAQYQLDPRVVQRLVDGVDRCYREAESQLSTGLSMRPENPADNLYLRTTGSKILPYSVDLAGQVAWSQFAVSVRPTARCFVDEIVQASDDTVLNRFATELHADGSKMVVFGWQVKRRYVQAGRVVVVWQSIMDPLEFRDQRVAGATYEERGFYVIHCPPHLPKDFSLLETSYRVAPCSPTASTWLQPQQSAAMAVTEFVLNWMAAAIPANHQVLEDSLFDQALTLRA